MHMEVVMRIVIVSYVFPLKAKDHRKISLTIDELDSLESIRADESPIFFRTVKLTLSVECQNCEECLVCI